MLYNQLFFLITVAVRSTTPGMKFRGFILQGRLVADDVTPVGTFSVTDTRTKLRPCSADVSIYVGIVINQHTALSESD